MQKSKDWFETWFDSPYYHILYQNRDLEEAKHFISKLFSLSELKDKEKVLDLACGKGRHAYQMSKYAPYVLGLDLSINSINEANKEYAHNGLNFDQHDMRDVYAENTFDLVCNLFTSFGYFDSEEENKSVFTSVHKMLKAGGYFVFDFMNTDKVTKNLVAQEQKHLSGIDFEIKKEIANHFILKDISFEVAGSAYHFQEKVFVLPFEKAHAWLKSTGFNVVAIYGDYELNPYDNINSDRMVFIAQKK